MTRFERESLTLEMRLREALMTLRPEDVCSMVGAEFDQRAPTEQAGIVYAMFRRWRRDAETQGHEVRPRGENPVEEIARGLTTRKAAVGRS